MKYYDDLPKAIRDELKYCNINWMTDRIYVAWCSGQYTINGMVNIIRARNRIEDGQQ